MKKTLLGALALSGLLFSGTVFTGCDSTPKDSTATVTYLTCNLITPLDGGASYATKGLYSFNFNLSQWKVAFTTGDLQTNDKRYSFVTNETDYLQFTPYNGMVYYIKGFTGNVDNSATLPLKDSYMWITSNFYYYPSAIIPTYTHPSLVFNGEYIQPALIGSYQVGEEFKVKTFMPDAFYAGTTHTTFPTMGGAEGTYENKDMYYRVLVDVVKNKADVMICNARFSNSEKEPLKAFVYLKDMDVTFGNGYYRITGADITPKLYEGGKFEDYPSFNIKSFDMTTTGADMTGAVMDYIVEHTQQMGEMTMTVTYTGHFTGSYATLPDLSAVPQQ